LSILQEAQSQEFVKPRYEYKQWHNKAGPGKLGQIPVDKETIEPVKQVQQMKQSLPVAKAKIDALRQLRRDRGECFKCGGKYGPTHQCPKQISLAVVEELCAGLEVNPEAEHDDQKDGHTTTDSSESEGEQSMCLSAAATQGTMGKKTIRLLGHIGKTQVLILIDSGSSGNFINSDLVNKLQLPVQQLDPVQVTIANGTVMTSDKGSPSLQWGVQGNKFSTPVRVLPLKCYDMILGMDWLETCNNGQMFVDWKRKKLRFTHDGKRITLRGINANNSYCPTISVSELHQLLVVDAVAQVVTLTRTESNSDITSVPATIQQVIDQHSELFMEPEGLPPPRQFDHSIPLIQGAVPVQKRPYKYAPTQKDELEKQIADMLRRGVIQPSNSPYASPVILVKKKDGGWRMCVDYRYLNTLTIKNKFPMPVVDELLDELKGSKFFTKLDL
jgi:hypothetical protein